MKILFVFLSLVVCRICAAENTTSAAVSFSQLIATAERLNGKTVRVKCTLTLFDERTYLSASGMTSDFRCDLVYLKGPVADWKKDECFVRLGAEAKPIMEAFRREHPELNWPTVEVTVDIIGVFELTKGRVEYLYRPEKMLDYKVVAVTGLDGRTNKPVLRRFSVSSPTKLPIQRGTDNDGAAPHRV